MPLEFANARHINRLWRLFKRLLSLSEARIAVLERLIQHEDIGDDLLSVIDSASHVLFAIDKHGWARFPAGVRSRRSETEENHHIGGTLSITDCKVTEADEPGMFYLLDCNDRILLSIDADGNTDFKGIPNDIKTRLDGLEKRIAALEGNS